MLDYFIYRKTQPGKVIFGKQASIEADLLGVTSVTPGEFHVKAKGLQPEIGGDLYLPLKGAKQISLRLEVQVVEPLITPVGAWSAKCLGPHQAQFDIKTAEVTCDHCGKQEVIEFIDFGNHTQANALAGMNKAGWLANEDEQICPSCR